MNDANIRPHQFKPGQTGNPGGRPKGAASVKSIAEKHIDLALATLAAICKDDTATPSARVAAANALMDRAVGKPPQPLEHSGEIASKIARLPAPVKDLDEWAAQNK